MLALTPTQFAAGGARFLTYEAAVFRAVAGMMPPGRMDLYPAVNTIQTLIAAKRDGQWRIALFQNTPAQFHRRLEIVQQLTDELRHLLLSLTNGCTIDRKFGFASGTWHRRHPAIAATCLRADDLSANGDKQGTV